MRTSFSNYTVVNDTLSKQNIQLSVTSEKRETKNSSIEQSYEQSLIDGFKEQNSPQNNRISEIYNKFKAGKELTGEELEYLAKNSPELYKEVKEVLLEREAMELQMKLVKTKQEVASVCMNELTRIKETMGTGKQAEEQAMKTMARTNQIADAHIEFTSSIEYREKEDAATQAKEQREKLRESQEQIDEQIDKQAEKRRDEEIHIAEQKLDTEKDSKFVREEYSDINSVPDSKKAVNLLRDIEEEKEEQEEQKKEQQRQSRRHKKDDRLIRSIENIQLDYETLWMKTKNLYGSHKTGRNDNSETNRFNLLL